MGVINTWGTVLTCSNSIPLKTINGRLPLVVINNLDNLRVRKMSDTILKIKRIHKRKDCTLSVVVLGGLMFKMLELPDKGNQQNISCIPEGSYFAKKRISPGKGYQVIEYIGVPNRTFIQIHCGNYTRQLLGCQLAGEEFIDLDGDGIPDITNTERTLKTLLDALPDRFTIDVS